MSHQHCPTCGDETEDADYALRWPWAGSCRCMKPLEPEPINYTGCDCHDSCNESWARAHMGADVVKALEAKPRTVLDYRQLADGTWKLKEERVGDEASR